MKRSHFLTLFLLVFEEYPDIRIRQLIGAKNHFFPHYFIYKIKEQRVMQKSRSQHKLFLCSKITAQKDWVKAFI